MNWQQSWIYIKSIEKAFDAIEVKLRIDLWFISQVIRNQARSQKTFLGGPIFLTSVGTLVRIIRSYTNSWGGFTAAIYDYELITHINILFTKYSRREKATRLLASTYVMYSEAKLSVILM